MDIFGGYHGRGEDGLFIHWEDIRDMPVVTEADPGDILQVLSICGENGKYSEGGFDDLDYVAETRIYFMCLQINEYVDDASAVGAGDAYLVVRKSENENTDFIRLWPLLRDNLIH